MSDPEKINRIKALDDVALTLTRLSEELRGAMANLTGQIEDRKRRGIDDATVNPVKMFAFFRWMLSDIKYLMDVQSYLAKYEKDRLIGGIDEAKLAEEISSVKTELEKRRRGLDWVDNLLRFTPDTEDNAP